MDDTVTELDLRGLRCPLPALRTEKHLRGMAPHARLAVLTDDPLAAIDIGHLCQTGGHRLLDTASTDGYRRFLIESAAGSK